MCEYASFAVLRPHRDMLHYYQQQAKAPVRASVVLDVLQ